MFNSNLRIAICDDNDNDREAVRQMCEDYFSSRGTTVTISLFSSGASFLSDDHVYELLFLDIELGDMNGIDVMHCVEKKRNVWKIIFSTGYSEYMQDAFGSKTIGFLSKPFDRMRVEQCLAAFHRELLMIAQPTISIRGYDNLSQNDMLYIKSAGSYFSIHKTNPDEEMFISGSISAFLNKSNSFLWVHISKGIYINLYHVASSTIDKVTMTNGEVLPIGQTYYDEFTSRMNQYIRDFKR